jgi:hypothetical protein
MYGVFYQKWQELWPQFHPDISIKVRKSTVKRLDKFFRLRMENKKGRLKLVLRRPQEDYLETSIFYSHHSAQITLKHPL